MVGEHMVSMCSRTVWRKVKVWSAGKTRRAQTRDTTVVNSVLQLDGKTLCVRPRDGANDTCIAAKFKHRVEPPLGPKWRLQTWPGVDPQAFPSAPPSRHYHA